MTWTGTILLLLSFVTYVKFKYQEYEATVSFVIVWHTIRPPSSFYALEIKHNNVCLKNLSDENINLFLITMPCFEG